jgi:hypothetical protein
MHITLLGRRARTFEAIEVSIFALGASMVIGLFESNGKKGTGRTFDTLFG